MDGQSFLGISVGISGTFAVLAGMTQLWGGTWNETSLLAGCDHSCTRAQMNKFMSHVTMTFTFCIRSDCYGLKWPEMGPEQHR